MNRKFGWMESANQHQCWTGATPQAETSAQSRIPIRVLQRPKSSPENNPGKSIIENVPSRSQRGGQRSQDVTWQSIPEQRSTVSAGISDSLVSLSPSHSHQGVILQQQQYNLPQQKRRVFGGIPDSPVYTQSSTRASASQLVPQLSPSAQRDILPPSNNANPYLRSLEPRGVPTLGHQHNIQPAIASQAKRTELRTDTGSLGSSLRPHGGVALRGRQGISQRPVLCEGTRTALGSHDDATWPSLGSGGVRVHEHRDIPPKVVSGKKITSGNKFIVFGSFPDSRSPETEPKNPHISVSSLYRIYSPDKREGISSTSVRTQPLYGEVHLLKRPPLSKDVSGTRHVTPRPFSNVSLRTTASVLSVSRREEITANLGSSPANSRLWLQLVKPRSGLNSKVNLPNGRIANSEFGVRTGSLTGNSSPFEPTNTFPSPISHQNKSIEGNVLLKDESGPRTPATHTQPTKEAQFRESNAIRWPVVPEKPLCSNEPLIRDTLTREEAAKYYPNTNPVGTGELKKLCCEVEECMAQGKEKSLMPAQMEKRAGKRRDEEVMWEERMKELQRRTKDHI